MNTVKTNIGEIPIEDYLNFQACIYGFENYDDLKKQGFFIEYEEMYSNNKRRMYKYPMIRKCGKRKKMSFTETCSLQFPPLTRKKKRYKNRITVQLK